MLKQRPTSRVTLRIVTTDAAGNRVTVTRRMSPVVPAAE
jgi:hypothetical protein